MSDDFIKLSSGELKPARPINDHNRRQKIEAIRRKLNVYSSYYPSLKAVRIMRRLLRDMEYALKRPSPKRRT